MKTSIAGLTRITQLFDRPLLKGMGSTVDLMGYTFSKADLDLSTGFQRDAAAIWHDFLFVGMDIQKSTDSYRASEGKTAGAIEENLEASVGAGRSSGNCFVCRAPSPSIPAGTKQQGIG